MRLSLFALLVASACSPIAGTARAEQITSTCRITAVDAASRSITLVRKTATGEKTGVAKVADAGKVTIDGKAGSLASLTPPVDATVVFESAVGAVVEIRVGANTATSGPKPTGATPSLAIAPFDAVEAKEHQEAWAKYLGVPVEMTNSIGMKFVLIPPGEFEMGSTQTLIERMAKIISDDPVGQARIFSEAPQHHVRIAYPFYFAVCEVTQEQYARVTKQNPAEFRNPKHPVERVTWNDASRFCEVLVQLPAEKAAGRVYGLPTEAEWEFACRAGTTTKFFFGDDELLLPEYAWTVANSQKSTHPVGTRKPNPWGLYDLYGNVIEWCGDYFQNDYYSRSPVENPQGPLRGVERARRGGAYHDSPILCRSAWRAGCAPDWDRVNYHGIRVVLESHSMSSPKVRPQSELQ